MYVSTIFHYFSLNPHPRADPWQNGRVSEVGFLKLAWYPLGFSRPVGGLTWQGWIGVKIHEKTCISARVSANVPASEFFWAYFQALNSRQGFNSTHTRPKRFTQTLQCSHLPNIPTYCSSVRRVQETSMLQKVYIQKAVEFPGTSSWSCGVNSTRVHLGISR